MRHHISLDVCNVSKSVAFYEKVFGVKPQKQVADYAKSSGPELFARVVQAAAYLTLRHEVPRATGVQTAQADA